MDKFNFNKLVENPFLTKSEHVKALQKIVDAYPYCQSAKILLTKALHLAGNLSYEKVLTQTSAGMGERQKLKYWITTTAPANILLDDAFSVIDSTYTSSDTTRTYKVDNTPPTEDLLKSVEENLSALRSTLNKASGVGSDSDFITVPKVNIFDQILPFEELPPKPKPSYVKPTTPNPKKELPQGLINDFLKSATRSGESTTNPFKPAVENTEFFDYKDYNEAQRTTKQENSTAAQEKIDAIAKDFPGSAAQLPEGIESSTLGESISELTEAELLLSYLEHTKQKKTRTSLSKEAVNSILTKFIKEEPSIRPASKSNENLTGEDLSQKSGRLQAIPPSENFAELLVVQGKFSKAIEVFEELILKYPEKKPYFVTRIEELKNKLNL